MRIVAKNNLQKESRMAIAKKTTTRKTATKTASPKTKAAKATTKTARTAMKAAPAKRATTSAGRVPVNLTLSQAKRIQSKLNKVDTTFKFLDEKIANA